MNCAVFYVWAFKQILWLEKLTLNLLTTTIVAPPSNASKWQMGFNSAFKGLIPVGSFEDYGIMCVTYTLIKSHLLNRHQRVIFNNKLSKWDKINIGVPQGSVLGPFFFFNLY